VPAKLPGWHGAGPDVVKYIQTTAPGKEVGPSTAFCGVSRTIFCPTAQGDGCAMWYVCRALDMPGTLTGSSLELLHQTLKYCQLASLNLPVAQSALTGDAQVGLHPDLRQPRQFVTSNGSE